MKSTKNLVPVSAVLLSLALLPVKAPALDFDGGSMSSFSESISSLKAQSKDLKAPTVSTATADSSQLNNFWENLKENTSDGICKNAALKLNQDGKLAGDALVVGGKFQRYMKKFPDNRVALVDVVGVSVGGTVGHSVVDVANSAPLSVSISAKMEGTSMVVRPLENDSYCKNLGTLVKLYEVKTILPVNTKRITNMEVGEIWKMPFALHFGFGLGVGATIDNLVNVSVSAGDSRDTKPAVSLYRMDPNTLRLRLRLDRVEVRSVGASINTVQIPMSDLGLISGTNMIAAAANKAVNNAIFDQINKAISFQLSFGHSQTFGKKLLVEFLLNPNDPEQMANLVKFMNGDFGILKRFIDMGLHFNHFSESDEASSGVGEISGVAAETGNALGADSSFAGSDIYHGHSNNLHIVVPIIHSHDTTWASSYNRYQSLDRDGETIHVQQKTRVSNGNSINLPFVGTVIKYNSQKNVYVINKESTSGTATRPAFLYQQYEGFVKEGDGTARYMIEKANGVLKYVGVHGNGTDAGNVLPSTEIFPPLPEETVSYQGNEATSQPTKTYKDAVMSFKLMINDGGVQEIIMAPVEAIMKAYMNAMRETEAAIINKIMDLFTFDKKGAVTYDQRAVETRLGVSSSPGQDEYNPMDTVRQLANTATQVIRDIVSIKNAGNWKAQSEQFSKVAAGSSKSGLSYENFLKVAVQLVDSKDVSAAVYIHTDKHVKGEADVTQTYNFFNSRDNSFDNTLSEVTQMQNRFNDPAELTD